MSLSIERIVHIIACMYGRRAEAVVNITDDTCYLFLGLNNYRLLVSREELVYLEQNGIIEFDGGCNEEGYRTRVYILTTEARYRIQTILNDTKLLLLES